ncbi:uncharacterized protein LOC108266509 [Ictalurus punctatus]|uniref:Uncharacterized protein LOC108266509 n=1 Tax=Ictalurus punctatus TaxID=7998 RepID=A0A2D0R485_ICTPU|nr:uncharacterized protein LOC108266509 [Ictalurus punctatus]
MFPVSPVSLSSKPSPSTSLLSLLSPVEQSDSEAPQNQKQYTMVSPLPLPCWATQALCDLALSETELRRLREQQAVEAEVVGRGVERALLGAQREERRLLERVEQDHRDLQRRLEQLQRDNAAAIRVGRALIDQRLRKICQLRDQIKKSNEKNPNGDKDVGEVDQKHELLLKSVAELLQPWEISLSLKHVSFKPSAQPNAVTFGEIRVQDHTVNFPVGACGLQGLPCSLHASGRQCDKWTEPGTGARSMPDGAGPGHSQVLISSNSCGTQRAVRKIKLSAQSDDESGEDVKPLSLHMGHWHPKLVHSERESSQEEKCESPTSESKGDELFLAVPAMLSNMESEGEESQNGSIQPLASEAARKQLESPSPERDCQQQRGPFLCGFHCEDPKTDRQQNSSFKGRSRISYCSMPCPRSHRNLNSSHSCQDLLSHDHHLSHLTTSLDEHGYNRAPSPAESVDSGYTFIISSPRNYTTPNHRLSRSSGELSRSHINGKDQSSKWKWNVSRHQQSSASRTKSCPSHGNHSQKDHAQHNRRSWGDSHSLSMSVIDGYSQDRLNQHISTGPKRKDGVRLWGDRHEPALAEFEEDAQKLAAEEMRLVRQFGKQGSGRADLTLPSGVHATPQGQLFLVDCGNARVQVIDQYGNVFQQVTSPSNDPGGSSRSCRNYFDVAVNSKGLIALSCAAERALLIFNRHGRLLQTFGGGPYIAGVPRDELEAPRGVTVTQKDEFLVADIRKGTLTSLKLEPKTGSRLERTVVTGFHRPYLVTACLRTGLVAVSERGSETGQEPCVKVLGPDWNILRIIGVCSSMGPVLTSPWGLCIDSDGAVLVADWAEQHRVVLYPPEGVGRIMLTEGLSSPRGLALLPSGFLVVSDSMHHCIKIYQYK